MSDQSSLDVGTIDLNRTNFKFLAKFLSRVEGANLPLSSVSDVERLLAAADEHPASTFDEERRFKDLVSGVYYWMQFLRGFVDYKKVGDVRADNPHLRFVVQALEKTDFDPTLKVALKDMNFARDRMSARFKSFEAFLNGEGDTKYPIIVYTAGADGRDVCVTGDGEQLQWKRLDGYHRVFSAVVSPVSSLPFTISDRAVV